MKYRTHNKHGLIVVDKPVGLSSMDVVRRVRKAAGHAKTGHAGTLDPLASGVVICCVGKATKLIDSLMASQKIYHTVVDLSAFTTTDDREGERQEVDVPDNQRPDEAAIRKACEQLTGEIEQTPPKFSAVHISGKRAYKMARAGEEVKLQPRQVVVHNIDFLSYNWPNVELRITCGKGVYIRSMGRDLGQLLGTGGHLASLRREAVGDYTLAMAQPIERFEQPLEQADLLDVSL